MEKKNDFKPFISADKVLPEFTVTSVILGMILAVIFGGANAYLGLRVGMTVSASIPAAVISMGVIRVILKKDSILENNMVQTIGSAGESLAAGAIFTIPAIFIWASEKGSGVTAPSFVSIALIALCGGILGVLFMVPLRTALIVEEHGVLPYPEGTACAEVLLAGEEGGSKSKVVFAGLGIAAVYKFIADGLKLFPSEVEFSMQGQYTTSVGMDVLPALAGVGYICGVQVSSYLFAGGVLSYLVLIPAIAYFGGDSLSKVVDETGKALAFNQLGASQIWSNYVRYIGAGAVAATPARIPASRRTLPYPSGAAARPAGPATAHRCRSRGPAPNIRQTPAASEALRPGRRATPARGSNLFRFVPAFVSTLQYSSITGLSAFARTIYKAKRVLCGRTEPSLLSIFYFLVRSFV